MNTPETMTVLVVEPEKAPYPKEIGTGLEALQEAVGGYIQAVYPYEEPVALIVNEEGKLTGMPLNRALRDENGAPYDVVAGTMLVVGLSEDNFGSLSDELLNLFSEKFRTPEQFISMAGKLVIMPMEPKIEVTDLRNVPVYRQSAEHAIAHNELSEYKRSFQLNIDCTEAIERSTAAHYADNSLSEQALNEVIDRFGMERTAYVLANTVRQLDWDGRIAPDNKEWAKTVEICEDRDKLGFDRKGDFMLTHVHPGLVDLLVGQMKKRMETQKKGRGSVMDQLHKQMPPHPVTTKKKKEPER